MRYEKKTSKYPDTYIYILDNLYLYRSSYHFSPRRFLRHDVKRKKRKENPPFVSINSRYIYRSKALLSRDKRVPILFLEKDSKKIVSS